MTQVSRSPVSTSVTALWLEAFASELASRALVPAPTPERCRVNPQIVRGNTAVKGPPRQRQRAVVRRGAVHFGVGVALLGRRSQAAWLSVPA